MTDDEKIIGLFFARDPQGIRELDRKYGNICRSLSYRIVNDRQDAEECVNDAYLGAWNAIPPARPSPLLTYVLKIVRNISLKSYWKREADKRSSRYTVALEEVEACLPGRDTVEGEHPSSRAISRILILPSIVAVFPRPDFRSMKKIYTATVAFSIF